MSQNSSRGPRGERRWRDEEPPAGNDPPQLRGKRDRKLTR